MCSLSLPWVPEVFSRWGREKPRKRVAKPTSTTRSDAPRRWRARRPLASRVLVGFFSRGILRPSSIIFNSLSSMMLFKHSFGLTRSLVILYVHEHQRLGFGMLSMETAVIPGLYLIAFVDFNSSNCDRKGQSYPVEYYLESVEEYSEGKIHMS